MKNNINNVPAEERNVYKMVTKQILDNLIRGNIPWREVLIARKGEKPAYRNWFKGTGYSLLNTILLGEPGEYATWNQIKEHGGSVKPGAKSRIVTYWCEFIPKDKKKEAEELEAEGKSVEHLKQCALKYYRVFNSRDTEGVTFKAEEETPVQERSEAPTDVAEMVISDYRHNEGLSLEDYTGDEPLYDTEKDVVSIPEKGRFLLEEDWYASVFSGLVHSTAAKGRCDRETELKKMAEGEISPKEELTGEIGSSMIMNVCGLKRRETHQQIAAVCEKLINLLNKDYRVIVYASSSAEKAAQYILGEFAA